MNLFSYWTAIFLTISSAIVNQIGTIFQKDVINQNLNNPKFMKSLVKNPKWLLGLFLQLFVSGIFLYMTAQLFIGPALISGLMSSGLIVLAIGSVKILGEKLHLLEIFGIGLNIIGIIFLSFSGISINLSVFNIFDLNFLFRVFIFILFFLIIILTFEIVQRKFRYSGVTLALEAGLLYSFVSLWSSLITVSLGHIFMDSFQSIELFIFIPSIVFVGISMFFSIIYSQRTLREGKAHILGPLIGVPTQILPVIIHFFVFEGLISGISSIIFLFVGLLTIIVASFILGKRQTELEQIEAI
jgi:hypothetical protein